MMVERSEAVMFEGREYWMETGNHGRVRVKVMKAVGDGFFCASTETGGGRFKPIPHLLVPWHCDPAVVQRGLDGYAARRKLEPAPKTEACS